MKKQIFNIDKFIILFLILTFFSSFYVKEDEKVQLLPPTIISCSNEFSETKLIDLIDSLNFKYPEIVLAQAKLESGYFTSNIFKANNNLFGMKQAYSRVTLNKGNKNGHALYSKWEESVIDYALWYSTYASNCKTEDEFLNLLHKIYAEDNIYKNQLKKIIVIQDLKKKFRKNLAT